MIMTAWLARQDKPGWQLARTQFEQQSAAWRRRHVAQRRRGAQEQAGEQGPYSKMSYGGSEYHRVQTSACAPIWK